MSEINPFLPKLLLVMVFHHSSGSPNEDRGHDGSVKRCLSVLIKFVFLLSVSAALHLPSVTSISLVSAAGVPFTVLSTVFPRGPILCHPTEQTPLIP